MKSPYIVFIGDSLTEYFDWSRRFPRCRVDNLGVAGETVEGLLERLQYIRATVRQPDFLFVMTGINNIAMEELDFLGPLRVVLQSLATRYGRAAVVLQSVLPARLPWLRNNLIDEVNAGLKLLAVELGVEYLELYEAFVGEAGLPREGCLLEDGVHLSEGGYRLWAELIEKFLSRRGLP